MKGHGRCAAGVGGSCEYRAAKYEVGEKMII